MSAASRRGLRRARRRARSATPRCSEVIRDGQDYMQDLVRAGARGARLAGRGAETRSASAPPHAGAPRPLRRAVRRQRREARRARLLRRRRGRGARVRRRARAPQGRRLIVKSKSMVTEEIDLNPALEAAGVEVVETDLGEYIIQLCGERPFHIVGPAIHKTLEQIRELFCALAGERAAAGPATRSRAFARRRLREKFLTADMGITGANFGVADTGTIVLVTNEGNGRMTTTLPRTHVVVMGIERIVPDFESLEPILTVLPWAGGGRAHHLVRHGHHRAAPRRATPTGPRSCTWCSSTTAARRSSARQVPGGPALHPLRRLPRRLPRLPPDRRPRLRLRVLRAHRRRAQPACSTGSERTPSCPSPRASAAPAARSARRASRSAEYLLELRRGFRQQRLRLCVLAARLSGVRCGRRASAVLGGGGGRGAAVLASGVRERRALQRPWPARGMDAGP